MGGGAPFAVVCSVLSILCLTLPVVWYFRGYHEAWARLPASTTWWVPGASPRRTWGIVVFRGVTFAMMLIIQIFQFAQEGARCLKFLTVWSYILLTLTFGVGLGLSLEGRFLMTKLTPSPSSPSPGRGGGREKGGSSGTRESPSLALARSSQADVKIGMFPNSPTTSPKIERTSESGRAAEGGEGISRDSPKSRGFLSESRELRARHVAYIVLCQLGLTVALFIVIVYWGLLHPKPKGHSTWFQHLVNLISIIMECTINNVPLVISSVVFPLLYIYGYCAITWIMVEGLNLYQYPYFLMESDMWTALLWYTLCLVLVCLSHLAIVPRR
uniref:Uncharacterized protein n=1 Tax=Lotharella oceanica TaxID=641309 RepID=A0A7S2TX04_9EUKA|mmetsp:Transcript_32059/g.59685  ORF Transcript_32059/g.59685 Transcript_32059/m.59685 type:complete len:328 (+) Transcript_32059:121-1104(+)